MDFIFFFFNTARRNRRDFNFFWEALRIYPFIILFSWSLSSSPLYCATKTFHVPELFLIWHHIIHTTSTWIQWANCTAVPCKNRLSIFFVKHCQKDSKKAWLQIVIDILTFIFSKHGSLWLFYWYALDVLIFPPL